MSDCRLSDTSMMSAMLEAFAPWLPTPINTRPSSRPRTPSGASAKVTVPAALMRQPSRSVQRRPIAPISSVHTGVETT